jgi:hypothetical protein
MRELADRVWGRDLDAESLGRDAMAFLRELAGPSLILVPGRDRTRLRVVSTLLHGNEPSGVGAIHRWLLEGPSPAVDVLVFLGAVETALAPPGFAYRFLPGAGDLNRCWLPPHPGEEGALARQVLERLRSRAPECLVDLHNNTGDNPAYGVSPRIGLPERNLVTRFAHRIVHTPLQLGTLVEATCDEWPSVTVECGRAGDPLADGLALAGTRRLLEADSLDLDGVAPLIEVVVDPVRVSLRSGIDLDFGEGPSGGAGLTISRDIDRHNFELLPPGSCIGWLAPGCDWPIEALAAGGRDRSFELFELRDGRLETRVELVPVMMTTDRANALADCLFYAAWPERRLS